MPTSRDNSNNDPQAIDTFQYARSKYGMDDDSLRQVKNRCPIDRHAFHDGPDVEMPCNSRLWDFSKLSARIQKSHP
jgi:hypothetical protein